MATEGINKGEVGDVVEVDVHVITCCEEGSPIRHEGKRPASIGCVSKSRTDPIDPRSPHGFEMALA